MDDDKIEEQEWFLVKEHLQSCSTIEQYYFVLCSNYDGNRKALTWLVNNPETDLGVIFGIYYNMEPEYYTRYGSINNVSDFEKDDYSLLMTIEGRVLEQFYSNKQIQFKPNDWLSDDTETIIRPIPTHMLENINGETIIGDDIPKGYDEGVPLKLAEKIHSLYK